MENLEQPNNKNLSLSLIGNYGSSDSESSQSGDESPSLENTVNDELEEPVELSEMVLKNNFINACAHGPMPSGAMSDCPDTTTHMIIDSAESGIVEYEVTEYREVDSESFTSDTSSDVDSVKDVIELSSSEEEGSIMVAKKQAPPRVDGELDLDDLPPIEDLAISLPAQETTMIGTIASIVDKLVIVQAQPGTPAVDIDSILFLEKGAKALGKVFDVFGPVTEPHYCVRFNSTEHIRDRGVEPGMEIYIAPQSHHTNYVFLAELMKMKGSDASWLHDIEPPPSQLDFSDDEQERRANRARKEAKKQPEQSSDDGESSAQSVTDKRIRPGHQEAFKRNQRPAESSSRFGGVPSFRNRNPFSAGSRRYNQQNPVRFSRPWPESFGMRTPHNPNRDPGGPPPFSAPPTFPPHSPPMFPPLFNPHTPPPFMNASPRLFQFGRNPRISGPHFLIPPPFRPNLPVFGTNFCNLNVPQPQWSQPPPNT